MKLSDYVFRFIADLGTDTVFMVVGGANSHLVDSLSKNHRLKYVCTQHEQAASMAAEGYARSSGKIGICLVSSGPGCTNAMTGLCGAWYDSIPIIFISGQVPSNLVADGKTIRQLGVQQMNIVDGVKPYTKLAVMITDPRSIRYILEKTIYLMKNGRPGPVWLDIPTEIQREEIDPDELNRFVPPKQAAAEDIKEISQIKKWFTSATRPVIIAGHGIRLAGAIEKFRHLVDRLGVPVITSWNGIDIIPHSHPLYIGCSGVRGQRGANFAVANSDLILSIGSRMDTRQVGNDRKSYARAAKKIVVDVDEHELKKDIIKIDMPVVVDAGRFIEAMLEVLPFEITDIEGWVKKCQEWRKKYPVILPEYYNRSGGEVNSYVFINELCKQLYCDDIILTDMGTSLTCTMQAFFVKGYQRLFTNTGFASMGFGLPATIGAWFGRINKNLNRIIGIYGDGGFQMNIQELQTIFHYKIPVKIFILNNRAYLTIKHTQIIYFGGNMVGSGPDSGYSFPSFNKVANAYGITSFLVDNQKNLSKIIKQALETDGPVLCEIMMPTDQPLIPLSSLLDKSMGHAGSPIERMYPYLPEEEFRQNMIIDPVGINITALLAGDSRDNKNN